ncbi:MAG: glycerol-3-phosphate acyltransferase [Phycisphaerae bacterium]|nr:glycerol-3-phosphate acyltransferase [Phycisphaerae bacterium]
MSHLASLALFALAGYLAGSIPFALLAGLAKGVDLRRVGSQNIGASNAGRVLGSPWFFVVLFLDALKGFVPVLLVVLWLGQTGAFASDGDSFWQQCAMLVVAMAAILGHLFPIYLGFRGGRGVATSLGVVLAIWPYYTIPGLLAFALWGIVKKVSGYISVASIAACGGFPVLVVLVGSLAGWPLRSLTPLIGFAILIAALVVVRHWPNIQRLRAGQELSPDRASAEGDQTEALKAKQDR